jgi:8-oxo-dGTP pyrophosphatase MutT (NUDIX family)
MTSTEPEQRQAARIILFDAQQRVLLMQHRHDNGVTYWATPGGGRDPGETFEQAALREAREELGFRASSSKFLWRRMTDLIFLGRPVRQEEHFFLVTGDLPPLSSKAKAMQEHEGILAMRWWSIDEIEKSHETIYPPELVQELRKLVR